MNYRSLTEEEISTMVRNGCTSTDWLDIKVKDGFNCNNYTRVSFSGKITLGITDENVVGTAGITVPSGIHDAALQNCEIGDNVYIAHVWERIMNYVIEDGAYITNVGSLICTGSRSFGNGTEVSVLNETGGRKVPIYEEMSSQIAYLMAMYRHDTRFTEKMKTMIGDYCSSKKSAMGRIGRLAKITNLGSGTDVVFDDESYTNSCSLLWDGTVGRRAFAGPGVVGEHFILASEACVDKGSIIKNVFVGQKAMLTNGFIATDCLFFSNCMMEAGEAVSVFAGPHTVSMHRSTLLIGGLFSFFNAGSATNQSNHLYRVGPVHQGIMERGCKTGSGAYIMWPARIGSFTLVTGKHYHHPDTSDLPYSVVREHNGNTLVVPGANLKTFGTIRDILKWEQRDTRSTDIPRLDIINYAALTPLTTRLMYNGINFLSKYNPDSDTPSTRNFDVDPSAIKRGRELYALGVDFFMGHAVINKLSELSKQDVDWDNIGQALHPDGTDGCDDWIDMAGLVAPGKTIDGICDKVVSGEINTLQALAELLNEVHHDYRRYAWQYVADNFKSCYGVRPENLSRENLISIIHRWTETIVAIVRERNTDALKDFNDKSKIGYGINGDTDRQNADFLNVRGLPEKNEHIISVHDHYTRLLNKAYNLIGIISNGKKQ